MSGGAGPLELLHPSGVARRALVLGENCPDRLRPAATVPGPPCDLILLTPSRRESSSREWVESAGHQVAASLDRNGLAYVLAPRGARRAMARVLAGQGLEVSEHLLHLPDVAKSRLLLPLRRRSLGGAALRLLPPGAQRRGLALALRIPGAVAALRTVHEPVGLVVRHPAAAPLAGWLGMGAGGTHRLAAIRTRWRADRTTCALHLLGDRAAPPAVVKVALRVPDGADPARAEAEALASLGPAARAAGVAVPTATVIERDSACAALRLELIPGVAAGPLLARDPGRGEELLRCLGGWLEAWSRSTARGRPLDRALLEAWVLGPLSRLSGQLDDPGYVSWLEARCRALEGRNAPVVACHNDLTMANVLVQRRGALGVIDWESAGQEGMPLGDYLYAAVDLAAARTGYRDRAGAFERCFGSSRRDGTFDEVLTRLRRAVELPDAYATLAFHGCWLRHADNERRKRAPGEPLPFLGYARRAAALRVEL